MPPRIALPPPDPNKNPLTLLNSRWVVTINTNTARNEVIKPFRLAWTFIKQNLEKFMLLRPGGNVLEVRAAEAYERGPIYHKIHLHADIQALTTGLVYIDPFKLQSFINRRITASYPAFKGCYVNVRVVRNFNAPAYIEAYLAKQRKKVKPEEYKRRRL